MPDPVETAPEGEEQKTPVEIPAPSGEPKTDAVVTDPPAEGDKSAETTEEPKAAAPEIPEAALKAAAEKYANATMAAARRTLKAVGDAQALKAENETYKGFVEQIKTDPLTALGRIGFGSLRAFLDHVTGTGGEEKPAEADEENDFATWRKKQKAREEAAAREARVEEGRKAVFAAVDEQKAKYPRTATAYGKRELWGAIEAYHAKHGSVPDSAVWHLASEVEKALVAEFGPISGSPPAQQGNSGAAPAASAPRTGGTTMTNRAGASAPVLRTYSLNDEERTRQINEELRKEGLLDAATS